MWHVYILKCRDNSLYTGVTDNIQRRLFEHKSGKGGHYTKSFGVESILYSEQHSNQLSALKRERQIKGWTRRKKEALISSDLKLLKEV